MQIPGTHHLILIQAMNYLPTGLPRDTCGARTILLREALSWKTSISLDVQILTQSLLEAVWDIFTFQWGKQEEEEEPKGTGHWGRGAGSLPTGEAKTRKPKTLYPTSLMPSLPPLAKALWWSAILLWKDWGVCTQALVCECRGSGWDKHKNGMGL